MDSHHTSKYMYVTQVEGLFCLRYLCRLTLSIVFFHQNKAEELRLFAMNKCGQRPVPGSAVEKLS